MGKTEILDVFQAAHDDYFRVMLKHYPSFSTGKIFEEFGPSELCDLAIQVHACAIALGASVRNRLLYLGLDLLYPFDNPVDMYNWRVRVKAEKIDHSTYASIAIRIDAELKRLRQVLAFGMDGTYDTLPEDTFLVSKQRYSLSEAKETPREADKPLQQVSQNTHIETVNVHYPADAQAVSKLEKLEKETTIGSNFSNIVSVLKTLIGG